MAQTKHFATISIRDDYDEYKAVVNLHTLVCVWLSAKCLPKACQMPRLIEQAFFIGDQETTIISGNRLFTFSTGFADGCFNRAVFLTKG